METCFARSHKLQNYDDPVYIKKLLSPDNRALEKKILAKRYDMIANQGKDKSQFKIKKLQLFYQGEKVEVESAWLDKVNCLILNCQSISSLDKRQALLSLVFTENISLMFLTETWLTSDIPETEIFLGNNFKVVNRNERESGEHGGLLTASSLSLFHKIVNLSIKRYYFSGGCVIIDDHCLNCFIAIYNPQTPKFQVALPTLSNCLHEY